MAPRAMRMAAAVALVAGGVSWACPGCGLGFRAQSEGPPPAPFVELSHPDLVFETVLDDPQVGVITDLTRWESESGPLIGVAGTHGVAWLAPGGEVVRQHRIDRPRDLWGTAGNYRWINADGDDAPELVSVEENTSHSIVMLNADASMRWRWDIPKDERLSFGITLVNAFRDEQGRPFFAAWSINGDLVHLIDYSGRPLGRPDWGQQNTDSAVARLGKQGNPGSLLVYGSHASVLVRDSRGVLVKSVALAPPNRYVNRINVLSSGSGPLTLLVQSTYGEEEQRLYRVQIPLRDGGEASITPAAGWAEFRDALERGRAVEVDLLGTGSRVLAGAFMNTSQAYPVGLSGVSAALVVRSSGEEIVRTLLPAGDVRMRHLFGPSTLPVARPDGKGEDLWVAWGSRLSRLRTRTPPP